jgi:hypothetical protein
MDEPKIIFPDIATTTRFALDETGYYGTNTTYFLPTADLYLLGLLNSSVAKFYFVEVCAGLEGPGENYLRFFGQYLEGVPIADANKEQRDRMIGFVQSMLDLHKQLADASGATRGVIEQQIDRTDRDIDALVYELYGLTDEEIAIVEGSS